MILDLDRIQIEHRRWIQDNFPGESLEQRTLGVCEEAGELAHAVLKLKQGIRGTEEQHRADAKDAIGDMVIFMLGVCDYFGWRLSDVIWETWEKVSQRDWVADPESGGEDPERQAELADTARKEERGE